LGHSAEKSGALMKKVLGGLFAAAAILANGYASAAPPAPPVYSWTGFYVGGDLGGAWTGNTGIWQALPTPGGIGSGVTAISGSDGGSDLIGGFHGGYNWQFTPIWVAGIEGDWSWTRAGGSFSQNWVAVPPAVLGAPPNFTAMSSKLDWVVSLRARFGYLVTPNILAYATGGVAWADFTYTANAIGFIYSAATTSSNTQAGHAVGGGLEWAIASDWLLRAEYLYYNFNHAPSVVVPAVGSANPSSFSWTATNLSVLRAGLSYKF
jgi:outer membrane immunogenic protein